MRSPCVVVGGVHGKRLAEMSLSEDQHSVGELGAHSQYEAFGVAVRSRAPWRDLDHLDACIREHEPPDERSEDGPVCPVQVGSMEPRTRRNPDAAVATFAVRSRRHAGPRGDQQWRRREVG
jgi:hypothetical protein